MTNPVSQKDLELFAALSKPDFADKYDIVGKGEDVEITRRRFWHRSTKADKAHEKGFENLAKKIAAFPWQQLNGVGVDAKIIHANMGKLLEKVSSKTRMETPEVLAAVALAKGKTDKEAGEVVLKMLMSKKPATPAHLNAEPPKFVNVNDVVAEGHKLGTEGNMIKKAHEGMDHLVAKSKRFNESDKLDQDEIKLLTALSDPFFAENHDIIGKTKDGKTTLEVSKKKGGWHLFRSKQERALQYENAATKLGVLFDEKFKVIQQLNGRIFGKGEINLGRMKANLEALKNRASKDAPGSLADPDSIRSRVERGFGKAIHALAKKAPVPVVAPKPSKWSWAYWVPSKAKA